MTDSHGVASLAARLRRAGLVGLVGLALLAGGCSPEDGRARGGGLGADVGNTRLPIELRGNRDRNNPSFRVPTPGQAPRDARGVGGWWANRAD